MKAQVRVTMKPEVLDPQGKAIQRASQSLGLASVASVRQGKLFEIELDETDPERARAVVSELANKLLANPVIEDFEILSGPR